MFAMTLPISQTVDMPRTPGRSLFWTTRPYWTVAASMGERLALGRGDRVRVGEAVVPPVFELFVAEMNPLDPNSPKFAVVLMYEVVDGHAELRGVWSDTDEPQDALDELRRDAKLSDWKRHAIQTSAMNLVEEEVLGQGGAWDDTNSARMKAAAQAGHRAPVTRRRDRVTDALLREVATVYRDAQEAGEPPTKAVAAHFYKSHSSAARWVGFARKAGHLPPVSSRETGS